MKRKMGRLTVEEQQFIKDNATYKNFQDIALELNRDPASIKAYIETKLGLQTTLQDGRPVRANKHEIQDKEFWPVLEAEFTPPELDMFVYHWSKIMQQFDFDVLHTEELQIVDLVKFEIMMNRNLMDQKKAADAARRLETELRMTREDEEVDKSILERLENQVLSYHGAIGTLTKEYREIQNEKNRIFNSLKATRADRIKKIDSKRESFITWLEELIMKPARRKELGLMMEKFRLATIDEEVRLAAYHKYEDGKIDQAVLDYETFKEDS